MILSSSSGAVPLPNKNNISVSFSSNGGGGTPECDSNISWNEATNYLNTDIDPGTNVTTQDGANFGGDKSIATSDSSFTDSGSMFYRFRKFRK